MISGTYIGVSFDMRVKKYRAYITKDSKWVHVGFYDFAEDAARAHDDAARKEFGSLAVLNFPLSQQRAN